MAPHWNGKLLRDREQWIGEFVRQINRIFTVSIVGILTVCSTYANIASKQYVDRIKQNILSGTDGTVATYTATPGVLGEVALGSLATKNAVGSADITDGSVTNADISASAAIAKSKLAADVQTSLGKADSALQNYTESDPSIDTTVMTTAKTTAGTTGTAGKVYPVQKDSNGKAVVSVPWTDTNTDTTALTKAVSTTAATAAVLTTDSTAINAMKYKTIAAGSNVTITPTADKITIASSVPVASNSTLGGIFVSVNPLEGAVVTTTPTATAGRAYLLQKSSNGGNNNFGVVNVPWTDTVPGVNGTTPTAGSKVTFYAPTTGGTAGQVLKSNGSGAPTWTTDANTVTTVAAASGTGNIVTGMTASNGVITPTKANVTIPVGSATATTYATIWVE